MKTPEPRQPVLEYEYSAEKNIYIPTQSLQPTKTSFNIFENDFLMDSIEDAKNALDETFGV